MKLKGYNLVIAFGYRKMILDFGLNEMPLIGLTIRTLSDHLVADHDDMTFGIDPVYEEAEDDPVFKESEDESEETEETED